MYLRIAPTHLFDEVQVEQFQLRAIIEKAAFWIKVSDHPKDSTIISQSKRKRLYRGNVLEMYQLLDVSPRAPHNRRNR